MEQNNFEKQVQQKMEKLNLSPSESSWNNIEKEIAQIRDRKRLIFLLSIFIPLVVFTGFYWFYNSGKTNNYENKNESIALLKNQIQKRDSFVEKPVLPNKNFQPEKKIEGKDAKVKSQVSNSQKVKNLQQQKIKDKAVSPTQLAGDHSRQEELIETEVEKEKEIKKSEKSLFAAEVSDSVVRVNYDNKINSNNIRTESSPDKKDENVEEKLVFKKQIKKDTAAVTAASKISSVEKLKGNWDLGFVVTGGTSFAGNVPLSINKSADFFADPATGGSSQGPNFYMPSKSSNSLAFTTGVFIQKNIFAKNKISIGLNYKYFSTTNKVGTKIDSLLSNYYSATSPANQSHNFHNKFHFLEVPVTFKLRLNTNKPLPLYWNAGLSISQLIATNALQFKNDRGLYFHDNSFFNKTQIGFNTGFSATLFSKNKNSVSVGPYFYYSVTSLSNKGLYNKTHFSFIGISADILLNKK